MSNTFENIYLRLRANEHRVYSDEVVKALPFLDNDQLKKNSSIKKEWKVRFRSTKKLIDHLHKRPPHAVLELGCGNGWLSYRLARAFPSATVLGIDINEAELAQAKRVFGKLIYNLSFKHADIFSDGFNVRKFDCIVVAGTVQYFVDLKKLIDRLLDLLAPNGEIHLVDSPFYTSSQIDEAKRRSEIYFEEHGSPEMKMFYHHHLWKELEGVAYRTLYDPRLFWNRIGQKIKNDSPFPWVMIS